MIQLKDLTSDEQKVLHAILAICGERERVEVLVDTFFSACNIKKKENILKVCKDISNRFVSSLFVENKNETEYHTITAPLFNLELVRDTKTDKILRLIFTFDLPFLKEWDGIATKKAGVPCP